MSAAILPEYGQVKLLSHSTKELAALEAIDLRSPVRPDSGACRG